MKTSDRLAAVAFAADARDRPRRAARGGGVLRLALLSALLVAAEPSSFTARVERVMDGDSLELASGEEVRLHGIDSPERDQPYADRARAELARLVKGKTVRLEVRDHDSYGRTVARVFAGEARFYLTRCGLTRLDGDGDGVPCEALCRGLSP